MNAPVRRRKQLGVEKNPHEPGGADQTTNQVPKMNNLIKQEQNSRPLKKEKLSYEITD